jgi:hypothetical protein
MALALSWRYGFTTCVSPASGSEKGGECDVTGMSTSYSKGRIERAWILLQPGGFSLRDSVSAVCFSCVFFWKFLRGVFLQVFFRCALRSGFLRHLSSEVWLETSMGASGGNCPHIYHTPIIHSISLQTVLYLHVDHESASSYCISLDKCVGKTIRLTTSPPQRPTGGEQLFRWFWGWYD